jgi:HEPN domain-containing protein
MPNIEPTIESIEGYIHFLNTCIGSGVANIQPTVKLADHTYNEKLSNIGYEYYIKSAHDHYFVSRTLFMNYFFDYSLFSAYQCIENYLKAFIKNKNQVPPLTHNLIMLKEKSSKLATNNDAFIDSVELSTIIYKYNPFYTIPRYPVSREKWFPHAHLHPNDIYVLDYFVMKFRQMLPLPDNMSDIFKENDFTKILCRDNAPNFYNTFLQGNINFPAKSEEAEAYS